MREAISLLVKPNEGNNENSLRPQVRDHVARLAELLQRQPQQVEESCIEGILDLIEHKCDVPLIVMETHLHLKYRGKDDKSAFPWNTPREALPAEGVQPDAAPVA